MSSGIVVDTCARGEGPSDLIHAAGRITVKIGSSLLVDESEGGVRKLWLSALAEDICDLRAKGRKVVVVSSGAVALGRRRLSLKHCSRLALKQAAAAAGQPRLMQAWEDACSACGIETAQLLLTLEDTESRRRWLNARATIEVLLGEGALPVINENDTVATEELRYGDNDRLSARVAQMTRSDLLILLSDVDGVYTGDPANDPAARHVERIGTITPEVEGWAGGASSAGVGSGGMRTKLAAARVAQGFGCATIIMSGREEGALRRLVEGSARATVIEAVGTPARAYKQWIAGTLVPAGSIIVDAGAERALAAGKSLLPAGATAVEGEFERGVCLRVLDSGGRELARGITSYTAAEMRLICGRSSSEIETRLGYRGPDELIHRKDMVLM